MHRTVHGGANEIGIILFMGAAVHRVNRKTPP